MFVGVVAPHETVLFVSDSVARERDVMSALSMVALTLAARSLVAWRMVEQTWSLTEM
jgi:hypothetical protein